MFILSDAEFTVLKQIKEANIAGSWHLYGITSPSAHFTMSLFNKDLISQVHGNQFHINDQGERVLEYHQLLVAIKEDLKKLVDILGGVD